MNTHTSNDINYVPEDYNGKANTEADVMYLEGEIRQMQKRLSALKCPMKKEIVMCWTCVSDCFPRENGTYLVYYGHDNAWGALYWSKDADWDRVTHWIPLPEPPEETQP